MSRHIPSRSLLQSCPPSVSSPRWSVRSFPVVVVALIVVLAASLKVPVVHEPSLPQLLVEVSPSAFRRSNNPLTCLRPRPGLLHQGTQILQATCHCAYLTCRSSWVSDFLSNHNLLGQGCPRRKREAVHCTSCTQTPSSPCRSRIRTFRI